MRKEKKKKYPEKSMHFEERVESPYQKTSVHGSLEIFFFASSTRVIYNLLSLQARRFWTTITSPIRKALYAIFMACNNYFAYLRCICSKEPILRVIQKWKSLRKKIITPYWFYWKELVIWVTIDVLNTKFGNKLNSQNCDI